MSSDAPPDLAEAAIRALELDEQRIHAWATLLRTDYGSLILAELREMCGVENSPHVPGDPYWTHIRIGNAEIWKMVLKRLKLSDEDFVDRCWDRFIKEKTS